MDHKPLIGLLTKRELGDIDNPRLMHLAERLLRWTYTIEHIAGAKNFGPDALSRAPGPFGQLGSLGFIADADMEWSGDLVGKVLAIAASRRQLVITWDAVRSAGIADPEYAALLYAVGHDIEDGVWTKELADYKRFKDEYTSVDGVVLFRGRVVVPAVLRPDVLAGLHRAHQGVTGMSLRAQDSVWWPRATADIQGVRDSCGTCRRNAPSQSMTPAVTPPVPDYPFQMVSSDYFHHAGKDYVVVVDRYSGWPVISQCKTGSSEELALLLRGYFTIYGAPEEIATDGASVYVSTKLQDFLRIWGVRHRVSTAYNPHSNLRAETAVKSMKRLVADNTGPKGDLDTDRMAMALLTYRNTPDRDTGRSPAQVLFARQLRDTIPCKPENLRLRPEWVLTREAREKALAKRHEVRGAQLDEHSRLLGPLDLGTCVQIQNQAGPHKNKWDVSGTVVEYVGHDAYMVKVDGSGRVSKRNRRFLRPIVPFNSIPVKDNVNIARPSNTRSGVNVVPHTYSHDSGPVSVPGETPPDAAKQDSAVQDRVYAESQPTAAMRSTEPFTSSTAQVHGGTTSSGGVKHATAGHMLRGPAVVKGSRVGSHGTSRGERRAPDSILNCKVDKPVCMSGLPEEGGRGMVRDRPRRVRFAPVRLIDNI